MHQYQPLQRKPSVPSASMPVETGLFQRRPYMPELEEDEDEAEPEVDLQTKLDIAARMGDFRHVSPHDPNLPRDRDKLSPKIDLFAPKLPFHQDNRKPVVKLPAQHGNTFMAGSPPVQPKLTMGKPGDKYEQEADTMAARVMAMPESAVQREMMPEEEEQDLQTKPVMQRQATDEKEDKIHPKPELQRQSKEDEELVDLKPLVQRQATPKDEDEMRAKPQLQREAMPEEEEKETLHAKPAVQRQAVKDDEEIRPKPELHRQPEEEEDLAQRQPLVQRQVTEEKPEEDVAAKPLIQAKGEAPAVPDGFDQQLAQHKGGGQPLSDEVRGFMEPRFGADFSGVRVHEAPELASDIQAQAFTHGQDIYFNSGKYNPGSSGGKELLAHELTHTIQQTNEKVQKKETSKNVIEEAISDGFEVAVYTTYISPKDPDEKDNHWKPKSQERFQLSAESFAKDHSAVGIKDDKLVTGKDAAMGVSGAPEIIARVKRVVELVQKELGTQHKLSTLAIFTHGLTDYINFGGGNVLGKDKPTSNKKKKEGRENYLEEYKARKKKNLKNAELQSLETQKSQLTGDMKDDEFVNQESLPTETIDGFVEEIKSSLSENVKVVLYACLASSTYNHRDQPSKNSVKKDHETGGDGSFADALRDSLVQHDSHRGAEVWGHRNTGDTVDNPRWRVFSGQQGEKQKASEGLFGEKDNDSARNSLSRAEMIRNKQLVKTLEDRLKKDGYTDEALGKWVAREIPYIFPNSTSNKALVYKKGKEVKLVDGVIDRLVEMYKYQRGKND